MSHNINQFVKSQALAVTAAGPERSSPRWFGPKVKRRDVVNMTAQLAIMSRSGVDISTALQSLVRQCREPHLGEILNDIHQEVLGGQSFSSALGAYPRVFDQSYVAAVAAAEASGRLPEVLDQLARLQRGDLRLRNSIRTMLAYPVILFSVSSVVLAALMFFVLPRFAEIFSDFDAPLPLITQLLVGLSEELRGRWWLWIPLATSILVGALMFARTAAGRLLLDRTMLHAALVRDICRALLTARACRLLSITLESGVPLLESLRLARTASKNSLFRDLFDQLEEDVLNGRGMSASLCDSTIFPSSASEMLVTAEQTGSLATVALLIAEHYEEEAETQLKELVSLLEPCITIVMGGIVAVIVMSVMLPLFDISSSVK